MYIICSRRLTLGLTAPLWQHREAETERKDFILEESSGIDRNRLAKAKWELQVYRHLFPRDRIVSTCVHLFLFLVGKKMHCYVFTNCKNKMFFKYKYVVLIWLVQENNTTLMKDKHHVAIVSFVGKKMWLRFIEDLNHEFGNSHLVSWKPFGWDN